MLYDAVVIGAGPAGITAALYLVRSGVSVALVENAAPGGQILSTAEIENYPGFPKSIKGWELADLFDAHLAGYPVEYGEKDSVIFFGKCQFPVLGGVDDTYCIEYPRDCHRRVEVVAERFIYGRGDFPDFASVFLSSGESGFDSGNPSFCPVLSCTASMFRPALHRLLLLRWCSFR